MACFVPDTQKQQDVTFSIEQWGTSSSQLQIPESGYLSEMALLLDYDGNGGKATVLRFPGDGGLSHTIPDFLSNYNWSHTPNNPQQPYPYYPAGPYIEMALEGVVDDRSGNRVVAPINDSLWFSGNEQPDHLLRLFALDTDISSDCLTPTSVTFYESDGTARTEYTYTPGSSSEVIFRPSWDHALYNGDDPNERIDFLRVRIEQYGISLLDQEIDHDWNCDNTANVIYNEGRYRFTLPGDLDLSGDGIMMTLDFANLRSGQGGGDCRDLEPRFSASIPINADGTPGNAFAFQLEVEGEEPRINPQTGETNFHFYAPTTGTPQYLEWRWKRMVGSETWYWSHGHWRTADGLSESYKKVGSTTETFPGRWSWQNGTVTASAPFAGMITSFFGTNSGPRTVTIEARIRFTEEVISAEPLTVTFYPEPFDAQRFIELRVSDDGSPVYSKTAAIQEGQADALVVRLETTDTAPANDISAKTWLLTDKNDGSTSCGSVGNAFTIQHETSGDRNAYLLRLRPGTLQTLFNAPGHYRLGFYTEAATCGSTARESMTVTVTIASIIVQPQTGTTPRMRMRLHWRDHLGSSLVSKTFEAGVGGDPALGTINLPGSVVLYGRDITINRYEPFGAPLDPDAADTSAPRYTNHEFDQTTGFHYMKGRYQFHERFNRPDPKRDWDWESPHTLNLYQYVRNDPINRYDPDGFLTEPASSGYSSVKLASTVRNFSVIQGGATGGAGGGAGAAGTALAVKGVIVVGIFAVSYTAASMLNDATGASNYLATLLYAATHEDPLDHSNWVPRVYIDDDTGDGKKIEGLVERTNKKQDAETSSASNEEAEDDDVEWVSPGELVPTQAKHEMTKKQIKRVKKSMKTKGYDSNEDPIVVIDVDGILYIYDGHHRREAARGTLPSVPVKRKKSTNKEKEKAVRDAADATRE